MNSKSKIKIEHTLPEIRVVEQQGSVGIVYGPEAFVESDDCKRVDFIEVEQDFVEKMEKLIESKIMGDLIKSGEDGEASYIVDLKQWLDPNHKLQVGIEIPAFYRYFVDSHAHLFFKPDLANIIEALPQKYSTLALIHSFLVFVKYEHGEIISGLKEYIDKMFPPLLVLMNINGLLFHRTNQVITFVNQAHKKDDRWVETIRQGKNYVYLREGNLTFLKALMQHPRVRFAFYSSIMRKNILPIIVKLFEKETTLMQLYMRQLFDQEFCTKTPNITGEKYGMIRDLNKVWDSSFCATTKKDLGEVYNKKTTLMLESDEIDVFMCHKNSLIVDRFSREDVWPQDEINARNQTKILSTIKEELFNVFDNCQTDI